MRHAATSSIGSLPSPMELTSPRRPLVARAGAAPRLQSGRFCTATAAVALATIAPRADVARPVAAVTQVSTTVGSWLHPRRAASTEPTKPAILPAPEAPPQAAGRGDRDVSGQTLLPPRGRLLPLHPFSHPPPQGHACLRRTDDAAQEGQLDILIAGIPRFQNAADRSTR
jgi:hypothetical protein